jgi:hypothetical protein
MVELVEVEPGKWRVRRPPLIPARSELPLPSVISDSMEPIEHVDGRFYASKAAFRAVTKAHGLTEVGNEKTAKPKTRASSTKQQKEERRQSIKIAVERYRAGERPGDSRKRTA